MSSRAMDRSSLLGECGLSACLVAPADADPHLPQASQDDGVGGDGDQNEQTEDGVFDKLADPRPTQQTLLEGLDHQHAEQSPHHRARSAKDVDATDYDGGHDL